MNIKFFVKSENDNTVQDIFATHGLPFIELDPCAEGFFIPAMDAAAEKKPTSNNEMKTDATDTL